MTKFLRFSFLLIIVSVLAPAIVSAAGMDIKPLTVQLQAARGIYLDNLDIALEEDFCCIEPKRGGQKEDIRVGLSNGNMILRMTRLGFTAVDEAKKEERDAVVHAADAGGKPKAVFEFVVGEGAKIEQVNVTAKQDSNWRFVTFRPDNAPGIMEKVEMDPSASKLTFRVKGK